MILKGLRSLFRGASAKETDNSNGLTDRIARLNRMSNGLGEYAEAAFSDDDVIKNEKAKEMLSVITNIELESKGYESSDLHYALAIAQRNYCAWFARGMDSKPILEKTIKNLEQATYLNSDDNHAKAELGRILIEEKIVRDRKKGLKILEKLKREGVMPAHLNSILAKASRQSGILKIDRKYNLCKFTDPSPAVFAEERKRFRALIRQCKKNNKDKDLIIVLDQYYNLAVLASLCYGNHDCSSAVAGRDYDLATGIVKSKCKSIKYTFSNNGYLENSGLISKNDWKTFVLVFGENGKKFNPRKKLL